MIQNKVKSAPPPRSHDYYWCPKCGRRTTKHVEDGKPGYYISCDATVLNVCDWRQNYTNRLR